MQVSSVEKLATIQQNTQKEDSLDSGFDVVYNQLTTENNSTTPMQEMIDTYKADLLAKFEESTNSFISSSDILNLILNIK